MYDKNKIETKRYTLSDIKINSIINGWLIDSEIFRENNIAYVYAYCRSCHNRRKMRVWDIAIGKSTRCSHCNESAKKFENKYEIINDKIFKLLIINKDTKEKYAFIIDLKFINEIKQYYWSVIKTDSNIYARASSAYKNKNLDRLHRYICELEYGADKLEGKVIDHKNKNTFDNKLSNLNIVTELENAQNASIRKDNTSGIRGVHFNKHNNKWIARIQFNKKRITLGSFNTLEEAKNARENAEKIYYKYNQKIKEECNEIQN